MVSFSRIFTIVQKDVSWAVGNLKLLGVMILPVFLVIFFSRLDSSATFVFSLIFVNAFVGIFSTSYLIIEEKNRGTLLALLTTPLTGGELLLGKFFFNLILCLTFSILGIVLNGRLDVLQNPLIILNIIFFAGTTCFFGYVIGLFFKNEQEMSVLAPFMMLFFCFSDAAEKLSTKSSIHAFLPDYHLAQSLKDVTLPISELLVFTFFSFLLFAVAFMMATLYTKFYFSNNREKRFSNQLIVSISIFALVLAASGLLVNSQKKQELNPEGRQAHSIESEHWVAAFDFDPKIYKLKTLLESRDKSVVVLSDLKRKNYNFALSIRKVEDDEKTVELRNKKVLEDSKRQIITYQEKEAAGFPMKRWVYTQHDEITVLSESFCKNHIFQVSLDQKLKKMGRFSKNLEKYEDLLSRLKLSCR